MLQLKNINKEYVTGDFKQQALCDINLKFRKCEFVSILGQSGSGKTTMLNIIGGLDKYTSGDLIINGKSTKKFKDRDWDTYRNHSIGFVFQSYNLIPHQSALENVSLALTLSGISKEEAKRRSIEVLKKVGLEDHMHKRPNQMSGGQMQRIAIARALVNDPDILLADEPTGALDSDTSVQIMDLLSEIAKDKLVIMVTHNAELAEEYSTRIVRISDGKVTGDSNPYEEDDDPVNLDNTRKTKMSFVTALRLSLNNLMTKKARTFLTSFAGSIGIIGIALILSLSNGVQNYIDRIEEDTLSSYPIVLEESTLDMNEMMNSMSSDKKDKDRELTKIYTNEILSKVVTTVTTTAKTNNLEAFKKYLESDKEMKEYINAVKYTYNLDLQIYSSDTSKGIKQVNPSTIMSDMGIMDNSTGYTSMMMSNYNVWTELINNDELLKTQYDVVAGRWAKKYNEVVLIVDENNEITDYTLYALGIKDSTEIKNLFNKIVANPNLKIDFKNRSYDYDELLGLKFKLVLNTDYYEKKVGIWVDRRTDEKYMKNVLNNSEDITIVGIIRPNEEAVLQSNNGMIGYRHELTEHVINNINDSKIVKEQKKNKDINIFTGKKFTSKEDFDMSKLTAEQKKYLSSLSPQELTALIESQSQTYDDNLKKMGVANLDKPATISIYPKNFENKELIIDKINDYNDKASEKDKIRYTDFVGLMMSSVTTIVNIISYVLMAFVSISLVVSSIMIGIITYISVLERTKEIGILRAIGASKKDISRVFNAETFIVGLLSGIIGIGVTVLLNIPINIIIKNITDVSNLSSLPILGGIILIIISMSLTVIAGLIPSRIASKKDPVEALRTE